MYTYVDCVITKFDDEEATITITTLDGSEEGIIEALKVRLKRQQLVMPLKGSVLLELREPESPDPDVTEVISPWGTTLRIPPRRRSLGTPLD